MTSKKKTASKPTSRQVSDGFLLEPGFDAQRSDRTFKLWENVWLNYDLVRYEWRNQQDNNQQFMYDLSKLLKCLNFNCGRDYFGGTIFVIGGRQKCHILVRIPLEYSTNQEAENGNIHCFSLFEIVFKQDIKGTRMVMHTFHGYNYLSHNDQLMAHEFRENLKEMMQRISKELNLTFTYKSVAKQKKSDPFDLLH